jgi:hypothetical protein
VDDWIANKEPVGGSRETLTSPPDQTLGEQGLAELAKRENKPRHDALREQPEGEASGGTSERPSAAADDTGN